MEITMKKIILSLATVIFMVGCKTTMIMPEYKNHVVAQYGESKSTIQSLEKSIIKGAVSLGWKAEVIQTGEILATLDIRQHQLVVLITHDDKTVSVDYKDSKKLKYDGRKIHRKYGSWVTNLLRAIDTQNIDN